MSAPRASICENLRTQIMQTLTRMNLVVIKDYYHVTKMDGYMNRMRIAHMLSIVSLNLKTPFHTFVSIAKLFNIRIREKK